MVPRFLDNRKNLLTDCGPVAFELLRTCNRVIVMWDLMPPWGQSKPCRADHKKLAFKSLKDAKVKLSKVALVCVERELECWLMADRRALEEVLGSHKHPHRVGRLPEYTRPDRQIGQPKTELISLFQRELGPYKKYRDHIHALQLVQAIPDWTKIRRSDSFRRFAEKAALTSI